MRKADRVIAGLATLLLATSLTACASGGAIATVNGTAISKSDFDNKLESGQRGFSRMFHPLTIKIFRRACNSAFSMQFRWVAKMR